MAETPEDTKINTGGGAVVQGSVSAGGDFIGRDRITNIIIKPPRTEPTGRPQLPRPPADFVGREAELTAIAQAVEKGSGTQAGSRIIGLYGLGGIGKTALALKAAERLQPNCPYGGILVNLNGTDHTPLTPEQALGQVIRVFYPTAHLPESLAALQARFAQALGGKKLILLLDNAHNKAQVAPLLDVLPDGCLAIVTSRVHFYYPGMTDLHLDVLPEAEAVQLLQTIAPRVGQPDAGALAAACGCLPLALQVTGSLLHEQINLSSRDVLDFMQDAVTRLEMTQVDASLELSYRMLPERLREPWRKLGVFAGDFGEDAALWVWGLIKRKSRQKERKLARFKTKQMLGELISYSLVEFKDKRYRLHELARLFALGKLSPAEENAARLIHVNYYCRVLLACNGLYERGNDNIRVGLALFDRERHEIVAGREWAAAGLKERGKKLSEAQSERLQWCYFCPDAGRYVLSLRLNPRERIRWLEDALAAARRLQHRQAEGFHLGNLGVAYADLGEVQRAITYFEPALAITHELGERSAEAGVLNNLGNAYRNLNEMQRAVEYHQQALAAFRETGDQRGEGAALGNLGLDYARLGDTQKAIEYYQQRLAMARATGDRRGEGNALGNLGSAYHNLGSLERAVEYYQQRLVIAREIGDRGGETITAWDLGLIREAQGDLPGALALMQARVDYLRELGHPDADKRAAEVDAIRARMAGGAASTGG